MFAVVFALSYALIIYALAAEASSVWLKVVGFIAGTWMAIAGAVAGWQFTREPKD